MFDPIPLSAANAARFDADPADAAAGTPLSGLHWLKAALAEIDYGVVLLDDDLRVVHANPVALAELSSADHPIRLSGERLRARDPRDATALQAAIDDAARRGFRKLIGLRAAGDERVGISVVPLRGAGEPGSPSTNDPAPRHAVLVMLGKRRAGGDLAIESFARLHGLSAGETRVLLALHAGLEPVALARRHGVAIATVRTQIGSIRAKTGAGSIRSLLHQLNTLPPLQGVLHRGAVPEVGRSACIVRLS